MVRDGRLDIAELFAEDMLGDDLDAWLAESSLMKRTFRINAVISGLIERRHPGQEAKSGRQVTISSDLIYDVLRKHDPGHILLEAAWADAATGLLDIGAARRFPAADQGAHPLQGAGPRVAAGGARAAGDRPRAGLRRQRAEDMLREAADDLVREAMQGGRACWS